MTSPTQRAGAGVRRWALNFSPYRVARMIEHALGQFVSYDDYAALQARIAELEARNAASERDDLRKLRGFAAAMLDWDMDGIGDVDGGTLQDLAEHHGLLVPVQVSEACGEMCLCADYGDFPQTCYRKSETLKRAFAESDAHAQGHE